MDNNSQKTPNSLDQSRARTSLSKAFTIALEFGFIIVIPLLAFGYMGKWLDKRYQTEVFVYLGIILALAASSLWFYRRISSLMKDMK